MVTPRSSATAKVVALPRVGADFIVATNGARLLEKMGDSSTTHTVEARRLGPLFVYLMAQPVRGQARIATSQLTTIPNACCDAYRQAVFLWTNNEE